MPFCTQCGHQNPDGARFCSQCGNRLEASGQAGAAAPAGETPSESTATITFGGPVKEAEHREERTLGDADAAAVDALPPGSALLVVQRGPIRPFLWCGNPQERALLLLMTATQLGIAVSEIQVEYGGGVGGAITPPKLPPPDPDPPDPPDGTGG